MVNYENGKIYKIINTDTNDIVYIGSTTEQLCKRYAKHHNKAPNHKIILIQNYSCNSKEELCKKEQEIIEQYDNLLNQRKAYCSEEQKKEYDKEYNKEYNENNKEQIKEQRKEYYEENKDKIKDKVKSYYEENKEKVKERHKAYREKNKEKIKERRKAHYQKNKLIRVELKPI